ncbi:MAG: hypothetical protein HY062_01975 [Bacteroidetes bacterium]|nr:hypothetical protein [Bacteroidota bacterium]
MHGQTDSIKKIDLKPTSVFSVDTASNRLNKDVFSKKINVPVLPKKLSANDSSMRSGLKKDLNKDSLKSSLKEKIPFHNAGKDSSSNKNSLLKKLKTVFPTGNISLGYDYGFLPYTINMPTPASAIKTEGRLGLDLFNIPLDVTFFYSTQKNLIGLNNYFRISYNADRYKDKLSNKLTGNLDSYKNQLGDLNSQKQQLMQKMAYTDYLSSISPDKWPIDTTTINKPDVKALQLPKLKIDTTKTKLNTNNPDSSFLNKYANKKDTLKNNQYYSKADSIAQKAIYYKNKSDSVMKLYDTYKSKYDLLNDSTKKTQAKINELETLTNSGYAPYLSKLPYFNKIQNFLSGIKKFDLGLCYPNYSTFLANNIPVRGINVEYQINNRFFGFTYGTTVSTLLYNNKNIDGFLQNVRNSYNYFDINNLSAGRKILSLKFGVGTKENNHFFVGFLLGKGLNSYLNPTSTDITSKPKESNLVIEADIRQKLLKNTFLDIALGKSSLQESDLNMEVIRTAAKEIFSNFRSYAFLVKLSTKIPVTKSNLTLSVRWVDPFFKSFGIGFIRSDNMRYEVKLDQPLSKVLRYTGMFRYEEDNLLKLLNYKNTFYSINNTISYKIRRGLMLRVGYTPLIRTLNGDNYHIQNKNSITTGIITFTPKSRNVQKQFNFLYNYYLVNTDSTQINFQNFAYYHQISFKGGFKTGLNLSWFKNNLKDSTNNNVFLGVLDIGYQFKNGSSITVAGKSAYKLNNQFYPGFILKSNIKLSKSFYWENQIEKFIVGDLFNGYDLNNLKKFPYYCSTKIILNF